MKKSDEHLRHIARITQDSLWIPCEEALPLSNGAYLITQSKHYVTIAFFNKDKSEWTWFRDNYLISNVRAWMEIPAAYKEE
jgi:hypothetical protein